MLDRCPHLFVMDPFDRLHFEGDSTVKLIQEATRRGFLVYACTPKELYVSDGIGRAKAHLVSVLSDGLTAVKTVDIGFDEVSIIWMKRIRPLIWTMSLQRIY